MMPLIDYFQKGAKNRQTGQIGLEVEHFLISKKDGKPMPYHGSHGVGWLLETLKDDYPKHYYEQGQLMGLESKEVLITLEPGSQLEISIACMADLDQILTIYLRSLKPILNVLSKTEYECCWSGGLPTVSAGQVVRIDKKRYELMERWFEKTGMRGKEMMKATAAVHVSVDYQDEEDFIRKYRVANILHPLFAFLCSHTPMYAGIKNEDILLRDSIWQDTDPARCGIFPKLFDADFGFETYAQAIQEMPLILMNDQGQFIDTQAKTCEEVAQIYGYDHQAIAHYLSMVFWNVRLKQFIEIRSADSMPPLYTQAYCALIKGLFYQESTIQKYLALTAQVQDIQEALDHLRKDGYDAQVYGYGAKDLLQTMLEDAKKGLDPKEQAYLVPLEELVSMRSHRMDLSIEESYRKWIETHWLSSKESAMAITHAIQKSELNLGGNMYTRTLHIPKIFTQQDKQIFQSIVKTTYGIFTKVIQAYKKDAEIRKCFGFSSELEELILCEPAYASPIPICRIDIFYQENTKDFAFCEFNTDGTSAMNENKRLNDFLKLNNIYQKDPHAYEILELVDSWADALIQTMNQDPIVSRNSRIGICDFLENAYYTELYVFEKVFQEKGYDCEVVDIRQLEYTNGKLISKKTKKPIDVIYRRAVTRDVMDHYDEIQPFIQAYKDHAICCIGAFQTQLVHHKQITQVLMDPRMQKYFTQEEVKFIEAHCPLTYDLTESILEKVTANKDQWIIKPKDSYASKGVWAGVDLHLEQWKTVLEAHLDQNYIVQRYVTPYHTTNIDLVNQEVFMEYSNMTGLYVYNGEFAGVYSRLSDGGIISTQYNEKTISTLFLR